MGQEHSIDESDHDPVLPEFTLQAIADVIRGGKAKNIIVMSGAGISVAAGIPDFRSPDTGLYAQLQEYDLPSPQAVFELDFFRKNPKPFFKLSKVLFPGEYSTTPVHAFITLLHRKGLLLRTFTQNIDGLERMAGLPEEKVVECHGTFTTARCLKCGKKYTQDFVKDELFVKDVEVVNCTKPATDLETGEPTECNGVVKPDIVFFGESLPSKFGLLSATDYSKCDLLIVTGTSLTVHPFASLVLKANVDCPRLIINNDVVGEELGFRVGKENNYRDVFAGGNCQETVEQLVDMIGWREDFDKLKAEVGAKISPPPKPVVVLGLEKKKNPETQGTEETDEVVAKLADLAVSEPSKNAA